MKLIIYFKYKSLIVWHMQILPSIWYVSPIKLISDILTGPYFPFGKHLSNIFAPWLIYFLVCLADYWTADPFFAAGKTYLGLGFHIINNVCMSFVASKPPYLSCNLFCHLILCQSKKWKNRKEKLGERTLGYCLTYKSKPIHLCRSGFVYTIHKIMLARMLHKICIK